MLFKDWGGGGGKGGSTATTAVQPARTYDASYVTAVAADSSSVMWCAIIRIHQLLNCLRDGCLCAVSTPWLVECRSVCLSVCLFVCLSVSVCLSVLDSVASMQILPVSASRPVANNESSEAFGIITPGRRVQLKGHRHLNVNNFCRFVIRRPVR